MPGRSYTASAIGFALALFGLLGLGLAEVRERTSPWRIVGEAARGGWATLRRWVEAIRARTLFPVVRGIPPDWTLRQAAERVAATLLAYAPPALASEPIVARVFAGAARAR